MLSTFVDKFFRVWDFLRSTPYDELKRRLDDNSIQYPDRMDLYQKVLIDSTGKGYNRDRWGLNPAYNLSMPKDINLIDNAMQSREKEYNFFSRIMTPGSYGYNSKDMDRIRRMLLEWAATNRTFKNVMRRATNAFSLDDDDLDLAIKGFGIDFVNQKTLQNTTQRAIFLMSLANLYKIKGSPKSIAKTLTFTGLTNCLIREYWLEKQPHKYKSYQIRGIASDKYQQTFNSTTNSYDFNTALWPHYADNILTWDEFQTKQVNIGEAHWWYTSDEISVFEYDPNNWIKLPSLMPYFGIEYYPNNEKYDLFISVLEKVMSDQLNSILTGNRDLVPMDLGLDGYNENLSEKDLWITGYDKPISLVEAFLAFIYCQLRFDEYSAYLDLYTFLTQHKVNVTQQYAYPWSLQKLIKWAWFNKEQDVMAGVLILDDILRMYNYKTNNYYCSQNELINWWLQDPVEYGNEPVHTANNVPEIFYSSDYSFKYMVDVKDTTRDKILQYSGNRQLAFKSSNFEYKEILIDGQEMLDQQLSRLPFNNDYLTTSPSNKQNSYNPLIQVAQLDYDTTFFNYISYPESWSYLTPDRDYIDTVTHDGSSIVPEYFGKYPRPARWNWAIDSLFIYYCNTPGKWIRSYVENDWDDSGLEPVTPTSSKIRGKDSPSIIGSQIYYDGYLYKYISTGKWIRMFVENDWSFCDGPISPMGHVKISSDLARSTIKAKIPSNIAVDYIDDPSNISGLKFDILTDPLHVKNDGQTLQYDLEKLNDYIQNHILIMDSNGYLLEDFSYYYEAPYLYIRVSEYGTDETKWIRKAFENKWDRNDNGSKMFSGEFRYPNLDLTNRYDAARILRGTSYLNPDDLPIDSINDGHVLVSNGESGYPQVYKWIGSSWEATDGNTNLLNEINLGVNDGLFSWLDSQSSSEEKYGELADTFLNTVSSYIKLTFDEPDFDLAAIYKTASYNGLYKNLINFFKPKRARLLSFSLYLEFFSRLFNSIVIDEEIPVTKITQQIDDYVQRNDTQFIYEDDKLTGRDSNSLIGGPVYHIDDGTTTYNIPVNSVFGTAKYYVVGSDDPQINGFYFEYATNSYLNYHGVVISQVENEEKINGLWKQWILLYKKPRLDYCESIAINTDENILSTSWTDRSGSPLSLRVFDAEDSLSIQPYLRTYDYTTEVDLTKYTQGVENHWNVVNPRTEPSIDPQNIGSTFPELKVNRSESQGLRFWTQALCKDPLNFRRIYPEGILGYPENVTGSRISGYDADSRNNGKNEVSEDFWFKYNRKGKSYVSPLEDSFQIHDNTQPAIDRSESNINGTPLLSSSNFNANFESLYDSNFAYIQKIVPDNSGVAYMNIPYYTGIENNVKVYFYHSQLGFNEYTSELYNYSLSKPEISNVFGKKNISTKITLNTIVIDYEYYCVFLKPVWWNTIETYNSGPIHHRPVYIGIEHTQNDCYPCIPLAECCDYYDVGCNHDGATNPHPDVWNGSQWTSNEYAPHDLYDYVFDINTNYHKKYGKITDSNEITYYTNIQDANPPTLFELPDNGDTYCHPCDTPTYTADPAANYLLTDEMKRCGIYHYTLTGYGFTNLQTVFNGTWTFTTNLQSRNSEYDFPYGYTHPDLSSAEYPYEMVHVYHKDSGYHYWEIRAANEYHVYSTVLRTQLKEKVHGLDDLISDADNGSDWHVDVGNFLNGNDVDVCDDRWSNTLLDPHSFINKDQKDIPQVLVDGLLRAGNWITITTLLNSSYVEPGYLGETRFSVDLGDNTIGTFYICVSSDNNTHTYTWKELTNIECSWTTDATTPVAADDDSNTDKYYYITGITCYLYLYVPSTTVLPGYNYLTSKWIRIDVTGMDNQNPDLYQHLNDWYIDENTNAWKWVVPVPDSQVQSLGENLNVCGDIVPYLETYTGIMHNLMITRCMCSVKDQVEIIILDYTENPSGNYIKIETVDPVGETTRKEHRFIPRQLQSLFYNGSNDFSGLTDEERFLLTTSGNVSLPLSLGVSWQRSDYSFYSCEDTLSTDTFRLLESGKYRYTEDNNIRIKE